MRTTITWRLACPVCAAELDATDDELTCGKHRFPIIAGVPRLDPDDLDAADTIRDSFSSEWAHHEEGDRTWGAPVAQRLEEFLRHVDLRAEAFEGKWVLDAGCGNGELSRAIATLGCDVVAADIGQQVIEAHHRSTEPRVRYVQANLMRPPFRLDAFDVIYCAGVLHHTPSTRATFDRLTPALAHGGTIFVWLYHHVPGRTLAVKARLRETLSRLPAPVKERIVKYAILPQAMLRQWARTALRRNPDPRDHLKSRERLVTLLDSYTPRYRWEHTPAELASWYREDGLVDIHTTEVGRWGFGVVARRP